ncbi:hypothetical protein BDR22DRAFT_439020 [Usnea florida]
MASFSNNTVLLIFHQDKNREPNHRCKYNRLFARYQGIYSNGSRFGDMWATATKAKKSNDPNSKEYKDSRAFFKLISNLQSRSVSSLEGLMFGDPMVYGRHDDYDDSLSDGVFHLVSETEIGQISPQTVDDFLKCREYHSGWSRRAPYSYSANH